jgi:hypothetical protein
MGIQPTLEHPEMDSPERFDPVGDAITVSGHASSSSATYSPNRRYAGAALLGIASALCFVGAFLPWMSANAAFGMSISRSGMDGGDGPLFLAMGATGVLLTIAAIVGKPKLVGGGAIVLGLVIAGLAAVDYADVADRVTSANAEFADVGIATIGAGLYALFVAATLAVIAGVVLTNMDSASEPQAVPPMPDMRVKCRYCAELVQPDAKVCRFCGREIA